MRLMSWNLAAHPDGVADSNVQPIIDVIRALAPDILCLQEVGVGSSHREAYDAVREALGMDGCLAASRRQGALATAVLWRPQIAELRRETTHYGDLFYHGMTLVDLDVDALPRPLNVASLHLHPHSPEARLAEASVLHMKADRGQLTIAAGDFNALGLRDPEPSWDETRPGNRASRCVPAPPGATPVGDRRLAWNLDTVGFVDACQGPDYQATGSHIRVDWILLSQKLGPTRTGYGVGIDQPAGFHVATSDLAERQAVQWSELSDHRPIWADLDLSRLTPSSPMAG